MCWITVYINGKSGFQDIVLAKLENEWLPGSPETADNLIMFWLPDSVTIRTLKMKIGSKLILKYRLRFFTDLDAYLKTGYKPLTGLPLHEKHMISDAVAWIKNLPPRVPANAEPIL